MRDLFPGYYRPSKEEFKKLWADAVFSFDTNVLLNLYRFTEHSRTSLLHVLGRIKDRAWLTYQVALEFHDNRSEVVYGQHRIYGDIETILTNTIKEIEKRFRRIHLFRDTQLSETVVDELQRLIGKMKTKKAQQPNYAERDILQDFLADYFQGKVGDAFSTEEHDIKCKEAAKRFEKKIPPGFEDDDDKLKPGHKKFGDVMIWFQLIAHAKQVNRPIIFLTDDNKDDWWLRVSGKKIGPRPELLQEFLAETKQRCHIYSTDSFLNFARTYLDVTVEQKTIDEAKKIRRRDKYDLPEIVVMLKKVTRRPFVINDLSEVERSWLIALLQSVRLGEVSQEVMDGLSSKDKERIAHLSDRLTAGLSVDGLRGKISSDTKNLRGILRSLAGNTDLKPAVKDDSPSSNTEP